MGDRHARHNWPASPRRWPSTATRPPRSAIGSRRRTQFPAQIYDCQAAVRWLRANAAKYKIDPDRIGGYGYSAGGHLVALLGALDDDDFREPGLPADAPSARLQVVVAGGAPCDFRALPADSKRLAYWLGGTPAEKPDAYRDASPANYVTADDPPMFFFHGGARRDRADPQPAANGRAS